MCVQCNNYHGRFRHFSSHSLTALTYATAVSSGGADEPLSRQFPDVMCRKHSGRLQEIFCFDCKTSTCLSCFLKDHKTHDCRDVKDVAGDLVKQIKSDCCEGIGRKIAECKELLERTVGEEKDFMDNFYSAEKEILKKCDDMKNIIENHKSRLLWELDGAKGKQLAQMEKVRKEVERRVAMLCNFKMYSEEVVSRGKACDIVREFGVMSERAGELLKFDVRCELKEELTWVKASLESSEQQSRLKDNLKKLFGNVHLSST